MTPHKLAPMLLCLPPILYINYQNPVSSYSKAPWGLSVLSQVTSIFTSTTISPSILSRQRPNHYAFRAGQNLPDKEFRYLRTVIVTAADLAETCVFVKQLLEPLHCGQVLPWHPFSLSYGVNLPSSLTMLLPIVLGSSPHLPVSVCGTGIYIQYLQAFLVSVLLDNSLLYFHYILRYESFLFLAYLPLLRPLHLLSISIVQESQPAVHRLRFSASP